MAEQDTINSHLKKLIMVSVVLFFSGILLIFLNKSWGLLLLFIGTGLDFLIISDRINLSRMKNKMPHPPLLLIGVAGIGIISLWTYFLFGTIEILKQSVNFLKTGVWKTFSGIDFIVKYKAILFGTTDLNGFLKDWARDPVGWFGLHKIVETINGGLLSIILGIVSILILLAPILLWMEKYKILKKSNMNIGF